jgi:predicted ATPase
MSELPSGTVTFLFTDIEGSTRLLDEHGERYAELLADHRRDLREVFTRHAGVEVDTQGDAFFVAFARASDALSAAADAQAALGDGPVRVRIGVHTGEPLRTEEGYVGLDVHRAARIAAAAHGGQVVVSQSARDLAGADGLRDLGEHRLKDLSAPERLYQLGDIDFPPLKTLYQTNLPIAATPFIGRDHELAEVLGLMSEQHIRLLTLSGPGGTGKTRLALQAAAEAAGRFRDGVYWVPLASLRDPEMVLDTAAQSLGAGAGLADHIADKSMLLLFDNFEHVVDAAAGLADLLAACPKLQLLVTSRELLALPGEHAYSVPPLEPDDAVELFLARARATKPDFRPDEAVSLLCARLDQLPLALELAAARVRVLSPAQLLERLTRSLDLLKAGRGVDHRQQTLRATIEWSYDLLSEGEQRLFARVGVFAGGCTLEAAEQVCDADLDTLQSLVDKSLLRVREGERFWMLETIREYAVERLNDSGDAERIRRRHAEFFLALAKGAGLSSEAHEEQEQRHDVALAELANLRVAIDCALADGDGACAGELVVALELLWASNSPLEGMRRAEAVLERDDIPPALRARLARTFGSAADPAGHRGAAERAYEDSLELFTELGDEKAIAHLSMRLGASALNRGDLETARTRLDESLGRNRAVGNRVTEAQVLTLLGELAWNEGDRESALERLEASLAVVRESGFIWWQAGVTSTLAEHTLELGRTDDAARWAREALRLARTMDDLQHIVFALALLALVAAESGDRLRAATLWGAVEAAETRQPLGGWENERPHFASRMIADDAAFAAAREAGRALTLDQAVEYALSGVE